MSAFIQFAAIHKTQLAKKVSASLLSVAFVLATSAPNLPAAAFPEDPQQDTQTDQQTAQYTQQTPEQLQQLVAPIALYPDSLVAQILAASTFPEQVVEADRWLQTNPDLKGDALAQSADQQQWDPSVKALTAFPTILGNMDKNLSWTSSLGDAYYNQQQDVMDAIQVMRQKAQSAGTLKSTPQQNVTNDGSDIDIEPTNPEVVYVPAYDPWLVYGPPIVAWPGWYPYPGIWYGGPFLYFGGIGFGIGFFGGYGWGWGHWGFDWHNHYAVFDHGRYYSRSTTFYNRNAYYRGGARGVDRNAPRGGFDRSAGRAELNRPAEPTRPFGSDNRAARGYAEPRGQTGTRSGAFDSYGHGGQERGFSSRGAGSFGGGGGGRGGFGGGGHGGGGGHH